MKGERDDVQMNKRLGREEQGKKGVFDTEFCQWWVGEALCNVDPRRREILELGRFCREGCLSPQLMRSRDASASTKPGLAGKSWHAADFRGSYWELFLMSTVPHINSQDEGLIMHITYATVDFMLLWHIFTFKLPSIIVVLVAQIFLCVVNY